MPKHDERIDSLRSPKLRIFLTRCESALYRFIDDPETRPVFGALFITAIIYLVTSDWLTVFILFGEHLNLWFSFLFLLGVQYGRLYWGRKKPAVLVDTPRQE